MYQASLKASHVAPHGSLALSGEVCIRSAACGTQTPHRLHVVHRLHTGCMSTSDRKGSGGWTVCFVLLCVLSEHKRCYCCQSTRAAGCRRKLGNPENATQHRIQLRAQRATVVFQRFQTLPQSVLWRSPHVWTPLLLPLGPQAIRCSSRARPCSLRTTVPVSGNAAAAVSEDAAHAGGSHPGHSWAALDREHDSGIDPAS
jgi:hypothetical protein